MYRWALCVLLPPPPSTPSPFTAPIQTLPTVTFGIYDMTNSKRISKRDVRRLLSACLGETAMELSDAVQSSMVDRAFDLYDLNKDGYLDLPEYSAMIQRDPGVLAPLQLNINEVMAELEAVESMRAEGAAAASP